MLALTIHLTSTAPPTTPLVAVGEPPVPTTVALAAPPVPGGRLPDTGVGLGAVLALAAVIYCVGAALRHSSLRRAGRRS